jgi:hypothetical protein
VNIPIDVANPYDDPKRVTIRVEGLPAGWKADIDHRWVDLAGKQRKLLSLAVTPRPDAPACTTVTLNVYGVMLLNDYEQRYGGITPVIHLANPIGFRVSTKPLQREGDGFAVNGCTMPPQPNSEIALILQDNAGNDHVTFVQTDATGCFQTVVHVPPDRGPWTVRPYFKGNDCNAPTEGTKTPLDPTGGTGGNGNVGDGGPGFKGDRGERELGVFAGGNWPAGKTNHVLDPGFLFGADLLLRLNAHWRIGLQGAWHQFDENGPGGGNVGIANVSALLNFAQPWGPYRIFLAGGPGWYSWSGSSHAGMQLGTGFEVPVTSNAYLMTGITAHAISGGNPPDPRWFDAYLGFRFRLP